MKYRHPAGQWPTISVPIIDYPLPHPVAHPHQGFVEQPGLETTFGTDDLCTIEIEINAVTEPGTGSDTTHLKTQLDAFGARVDRRNVAKGPALNVVKVNRAGTYHRYVIGMTGAAEKPDNSRHQQTN